MLRRLLLLGLVLAAAALFFTLDLHRYLDLAYLEAQRDRLRGLVERYPVFSALGYFVGYVLVTALSLPGAAAMTLAGGAVFGLLWGTALVSFASTLGATLAFLLARFLFRDTVRRRFGHRLKTIDDGIRREGGLYLFTLRLIPVVPFFATNLLMGLTALRTATFWWVSQLGMLPGTLIYVNAGARLAEIDAPSDVLSPALVVSLAALGAFPLLAKKTLAAFRARAGDGPHHH